MSTPKSKPVVFFGSGPVAASTLEFLIKHFEIHAVVTKPPADHGHRTIPPVIDLAQKHDLTLYTPASKAELSQLVKASSLPNVVGIVVDYGLIIPDDVIGYFEKGIINSHFSLLPLWRGADPITFPLLAGDKVTGVSLMLIVAAMDEGDLIAQKELAIENTDDANSLSDKLINLSNAMLLEVTGAYLNNQIDPWPQDPTIEPTYSRKLSKEDGKIDWTKPAIQIEREVRAYGIWPKSYSTLADKNVVITKARVINASGQPAIAFRHDIDLAVYCGEEALIIDRLKVAGKPEMDGQAFLNGYGKDIY